MNIFKVLASGKKSFQEETASAILTWFLNPRMEHGLGYSFLSKFIKELSLVIDNPELSDLADDLKLRMRGEFEEKRTPLFYLEEYVGNAFIDVIISIDDRIIAIENKIYGTSVTEGQLRKQYEGLKIEFPTEKIIMVYLVPVDEASELPEGKSEKEFNELELSVRDSDFKVLVTWQKNNIDKSPSISKIISSILFEESTGLIDPLPEYTRHTLKALVCFISNKFAGYDYEREIPTPGLNPLTEGTLSVDTIMRKENGWVGVRGGIRGLLKMDNASIKGHKFQYTSQDMSLKRNWLEVDEFKKIVSWVLYNKVNDIDWRGRLSSESLYRIARDFGSKVFIGIRGGENALKNMKSDEIKDREWNISTEKAGPQWIDGENYCSIINEKKVFDIVTAGT